MVAEPLFTNSFVVDGIVPDQYGLRTVVEYRGRLLTVPHMTLSAHPPPADHMDIMTPDPSRRSPSSPGNSNSNSNSNGGGGGGYYPPPTGPQAGTAEEGDMALRHLSQQIDISSLGHIHPAFFAPLRCVPPLYLRNSAHSRRAQEAGQAAATATPLNTAVAMLKSVFLKGPPKRHTELSLLSWHWADDLLAVSSGAELDRVCAFNFNSAEWEISGERHRALYSMRCVAFRPFSGRVLALGCRAGVALLSGQRLDMLTAPGHTDIVSMDWSPDGQFLATAAANDGAVRLWDVATQMSTPVGSGSLVRFSPDVDSRLLFVADATAVNFRLWCCRTWTCERWGSLTGPVVAATWSADGSVLLFSTEGQAAIHVLSVGNRDAGKETSIAYVEMTSLPREGPGGVPILLEMDPTCERLAVVYEVPEPDFDSDRTGDLTEDQHRRFAVALYATQLRPIFSMTPIGYVSGPMGCGPPVGIKFKPKPVGNTGAVLTCMWRSGEVTFTHLVYQPAQKN